MGVRVGTSGWVYSHWKRLFYPESLRQKEWFSFYASHFDTVEINNSFYRLPSEATFEVWRRQAPPGFHYALKANRYLTHLKRLLAPEEPLALFFEHARHLEGALGPVLYQLPPSFACNAARFAHFLEVLPEGYRHVVEFRNPSWFSKGIFSLMERYGVSHCIHDATGLRVPLRVTAPLVYLRFHGGPSAEGAYPAPLLESWAERIHGWLREGLEVWAFFNNDLGGHAVANARLLRELLG